MDRVEQRRSHSHHRPDGRSEKQDLPPLPEIDLNLLITGATGFVGRNLLLTALESDGFDTITVSVRDESKLRAQLTAEDIDPKSPRLRIVQADDFSRLADVTHAIHTVGVSFARDRATYFQANVDSTLALATALPSATRLIVLSSQSAGGPTPIGQTTRRIDDPDAPLTLYGESKVEMERRLLAARPTTAIWRPPMILGPRDATTLPLFKMASSVFQIKSGRQPKTYSWIAVHDLSRALLKALRSDAWAATVGRPIYAAAPDPLTDVDLINHATQLYHRRPRILRLPSAAIRIVSAFVDAVPSLRAATPSLTRDRVREIFADRWVVDSTEFQRHFLDSPASSLRETLALAHASLHPADKPEPD